MNTIKNVQDLFAYFGIEYNQGSPRGNNSLRLNSQVYKSTSCGAWARLLPNGVIFGSIVEGSEAEVNTDPLIFPFTEDALKKTLNYIEREADILWREANEDQTASPSP